MSNSIWKTPDQKPKEHKTVIEHWLNCYNEHCYDMWKQRPDGGSFDSHTIEWCYVDDLITQADKAERLQKQLDSLKKYSDSLRHRVEKMLKKNKTLKNTASDYFMKTIELGIELEKMKSNK